MLISGLNNLDRLYSNLLKPGFVVAIAGPYGSGKTLLASTICHANAAKNKKCMYITFFETKDKFYDIAKRIGLDFETLEMQGLFTYIKLPLLKDLDSIVSELSSTMMSERPSIIIIDSINPLLEYIDSAERRSWLHDFLSQIPRIINGVLVVTVEKTGAMPVSSIEYIADVYMELGYTSDRGFISRKLCIKKARGSPLSQMEVPFTIRENRGIIMLIPETPRTIKVSGKLYEGLIEPFQDYLRHIRAGENILIAYPIDSRIPYWLLLLLQLAVVNNLRALIISYNESPYEQQEVIVNLLSERVGIEKEQALRLVEKHIVFESINPYSLSLTDLVLQETDMVENYKPDLMLYHGIEVLYPIVENNVDQYYQFLVNQALAFKRQGVTTIRAMGMVSEKFYRLVASISDIIIRFKGLRRRGREVVIHLWRKGREPRQITINKQSMMRMLDVVSQYMRMEGA